MLAVEFVNSKNRFINDLFVLHYSTFCSVHCNGSILLYMNSVGPSICMIENYKHCFTLAWCFVDIIFWIGTMTNPFSIHTNKTVYEFDRSLPSKQIALLSTFNGNFQSQVMPSICCDFSANLLKVKFSMQSVWIGLKTSAIKLVLGWESICNILKIVSHDNVHTDLGFIKSANV